ncbi:hypothetical protein HMN09_01022600 [Mycena chlorophos]|uniref:Domain of unknown function at the cortex 1 domain-containing protein n=1 Tax=Mycena chlorophos TaxID=658473 RepID=A0A8H6SHP1_MYCCL|nr:hypothetical protein HMN09_01022600 [Mycena chlorophos]
MPALRVLAGPSPQDLAPIPVNTNEPFRIKSSAFDGQVVVFIKGLNQVDAASTAESQYFGRADRSGITWSIQVQGRFLTPRSADDILFGNIFERPLKLPWGTGAALKFMKLIDPTLSHDLTCTETQKPWALSPLVATMPHLNHTRIAPGGEPPAFPPAKSLVEDTSSLHLCTVAEQPEFLAPRAGTPSSFDSSRSRSSSSGISILSRKSSDSDGKKQHAHKKQKRNNKSKGGDAVVHIPSGMTSTQRRSFFASHTNRSAIVLGPQDVITTDFCYGFLEFSPSLRLKLPGGLGINLSHYWDGQPVRFVCCERKQEGDCASDDPWGRPLWCVSIELDEDEQEHEHEQELDHHDNDAME